MKTAVVLLNLGGPDSSKAVRPFLYNLFRDPDIFKIPVGQKLFAALISKFRSPKIIEQYKQIGGSSPINKWTEIQRENLEKSLKANGLDSDVFVAMRYWKPLTEETIESINQKEYDKIILLPLYPHYSIVTTGSSFNEWKRKFDGDQSKVRYIQDFFFVQKYLQAINLRIDEALEKFPPEKRDEVNILFSAHSTPVSIIEKGDPYKDQIEKTVVLIMQMRKHSHQHHLCYQSKVGPVKWLEPSTEDKITELAGAGIKNMLVVPISFVSDHIETLFELGIEYKEAADENGVENFIVMEGLNDSPLFIEALVDLVKHEHEKEEIEAHEHE